MIVYKFHGIIQVEERWFESPNEMERNDGVDWILFHNYYSIIKDDGVKLIRRSETLVTDLRKNIDDIFDSFSKTTRYKIRRADRDGYSTIFYDNPSKQQIADFCKIHKELYRSKGLKESSPKRKMEVYLSSGNILISTSQKDCLKDASVHVYFVDGRVARLLYSVNQYRDRGDRNELGRANRKHHFDDISYFKERGYEIYDWGGCREDGDVKSVAEFKLGFSGIKKETYYYVRPISLKGRLIAALMLKQ